jgi:nicotinamide-nucleotide amidase
MRIEIIAVGSELLTPFYQDTDSLFLTGRLNDLGFEVAQKTVVGDEAGDLRASIEQALGRGCDLVFVIGGLGPTFDDITREVVAEALNKKLVLNPDILNKIVERFRRRGKRMSVANQKQAYVLEGAATLENKNGSAPGQWIEAGKTKIVLLPGPPVELRPMFEETVRPRLLAAQPGVLVRTVFKIAGLTESEVDTKIADLLPRNSDVRVTILARPGQIEVHAASFSKESDGRAEAALESLSGAVTDRLGKDIFSTDGEELEDVIGSLLLRRHQTLATAESCSGGLLASRITDVPGSSDYFLEGFVTYSNPSKILRLDVPSVLIEAHGAVSSEVARAMAVGVRAKSGADFGLSTTGIAGPSGGTPEKPVGLVYTGLAWERSVRVEKDVFLGNRGQVKFQASQRALDILRRFLDSDEGRRG